MEGDDRSAGMAGMELEALSHQCPDLNHDFIINQAFINEGRQSRYDLQGVSAVVYNGICIFLFTFT